MAATHVIGPRWRENDWSPGALDSLMLSRSLGGSHPDLGLMQRCRLEMVRRQLLIPPPVVAGGNAVHVRVRVVGSVQERVRTRRGEARHPALVHALAFGR